MRNRNLTMLLLAVTLLAVVVAVLGWMRPTPPDNGAHAAYVDSVNAVVVERDLLISVLYDSIAKQARVSDSLAALRLRPEVYTQAAQKALDGAPLDSLIEHLESPVR